MNRSDIMIHHILFCIMFFSISLKAKKSSLYYNWHLNFHEPR